MNYYLAYLFVTPLLLLLTPPVLGHGPQLVRQQRHGHADEQHQQGDTVAGHEQGQPGGHDQDEGDEPQF